MLIPSAAPTPAAATYTTEASQVIRIARAKLGDPWRYGATGPTTFDCSGLVLYAYRMAGDLRMIGSGRYRSAGAIYRYFLMRGKTSRTRGTPGDLVVWGNGSHIGIYLGNGMAVSTLTSGVRVHGVYAVTARFTAFLRTGIYQLPRPIPTAVSVPAPTPTPVPVPLPTPSPAPLPSPLASAIVTP